MNRHPPSNARRDYRGRQVAQDQDSGVFRQLTERHRDSCVRPPLASKRKRRRSAIKRNQKSRKAKRHCSLRFECQLISIGDSTQQSTLHGIEALHSKAIELSEQQALLSSDCICKCTMQRWFDNIDTEVEEEGEVECGVKLTSTRT